MPFELTQDVFSSLETIEEFRREGPTKISRFENQIILKANKKVTAAFAFLL